MIKCFADSKTEHFDMELEGNGLDLTAEVIVMMKHIYLGIAKQNPESAKAFLYFIEKAITEPDSPIWAE